MADVSISRKAVEAGLVAFKNMFGFDAHPTSLVEAILNAAAPLIAAAELDRFAAQVRQYRDQREQIGDDDYEPDGDADCDHPYDCHTAGVITAYTTISGLMVDTATKLRAQS